MTHNELTKLVGMRATLEVPLASGTLSVPVKILDGRDVFGRTDVLVTPIGGSGEGWVSAERVAVKA